jgi:glycerol-3-phosphate acyltransferase PlsY
MKQILALTLMIALSFAAGSTPTAYLLGRAKGIDIRRHGSGNIGATNAMRVLGRGWGILCLLIDAFKGWLPATLGWNLSILFGLSWPPDAWMWICGLSAIAGHMFTPFLNFRGGKGVAASIGVMLAIAPVPLLLAAAAGGLIIWLTGYVSLASIVASAMLPPLILIYNLARRLPVGWTTIGITAGLALLIAWKHRGNMQRLRNGTEPRIFDKPKTPEPSNQGGKL